MGTHDKAQRTTVQIGPLSVDGCQMPEINVRRFLDARGIKTLRGEGYTPDGVAIESTDQSRGQSRGHALSLHIISAYWAWEASKSNQPLCYTLMAETPERRFDDALGGKHRESDRNASLTQRLQQTESAPTAIGEAYTEPDRLRMEVSRAAMLVGCRGHSRNPRIQGLMNRISPHYLSSEVATAAVSFGTLLQVPPKEVMRIASSDRNSP